MFSGHNKLHLPKESTSVLKPAGDLPSKHRIRAGTRGRVRADEDGESRLERLLLDKLELKMARLTPSHTNPTSAAHPPQGVDLWTYNTNPASGGISSSNKTGPEMRPKSRSPARALPLCKSKTPSHAGPRTKTAAGTEPSSQSFVGEADESYTRGEASQHGKRLRMYCHTAALTSPAKCVRPQRKGKPESFVQIPGAVPARAGYVANTETFANPRVTDPCLQPVFPVDAPKRLSITCDGPTKLHTEGATDLGSTFDTRKDPSEAARIKYTVNKRLQTLYLRNTTNLKQKMFEVYQRAFDQVLVSDSEYSQILKEIKGAYEARIEALVQANSSLLLASGKTRTDIVPTGKSKQPESGAELSTKSGGGGGEHTGQGKRRPAIPRLDLSKIARQEETPVPGLNVPEKDVNALSKSVSDDDI